MLDAADDQEAPERDLLDTPQAGPKTIRGSIIRLGGYIAGSLLSIVSVSLMIRHLGVADFGRYVTALSLITIVQGVTDGGFAAIGVREYALRDESRRQSLMANLMGVRLVSTSVGILGATAFAAVADYGTTLVLGTFFAGVGLVLTAAQSTLATPLLATLRLGGATALDLLRQVLLVAGIVALAIAGASLLPFLALQIPIGLIMLVVTVLLVRGTVPRRPTFDRSEWWPLLRDVIPFTAAVAIGSIYLRVTVIAMSLLASDLETGYYATAFRMTEVLVAIPPIVVGATLPVLARAARDDAERLQYVLGRLLDAMLIVGVGLALAVVLGAPFAVHVLAGDASDPSIDVLRIQSIAIVAAFVATTWQHGLLSLHRHKAILLYSVAALVTGLVLTLVLVPRLEAEGAAIAFSGGEVVVTILAYVLLRRAKPDLRFSARVPLAVIAAAATGAAVGLSPLPSVVEAVLGGAVFLLVLVALRAIPPELAHALSRRRS